MMRIWRDRKFLGDLAERALMTAFQSAISIIGVDGVVTRVDLDWATTAKMVAAATALSVLKCLVARLKGDPGSASLVQ
jgi:hypothetical protein